VAGGEERGGDEGDEEIRGEMVAVDDERERFRLPASAARVLERLIDPDWTVDAEGSGRAPRGVATKVWRMAEET